MGVSAPGQRPPTSLKPESCVGPLERRTEGALKANAREDFPRAQITGRCYTALFGRSGAAEQVHNLAAILRPREPECRVPVLVPEIGIGAVLE